MSDNAWTRLSREFQSATGESIDLSLSGAFTGMKHSAHQFRVPVLYVDDIGYGKPSHFKGPDYRDPVAMQDLISSLRSDPSPREIALTLDAPQTSFSLSPAVGYASSPLPGWYCRAGASYGLDIYPEYVWDRVAWPDNLARKPPYGYFLGLESSAAWAWSNLPKTPPAALRPWQWGLVFSMSRSSPW